MLYDGCAKYEKTARDCFPQRYSPPKSIGPDGISMLTLKHLSSTGVPRFPICHRTYVENRKKSPTNETWETGQPRLELSSDNSPLLSSKDTWGLATPDFHTPSEPRWLLSVKNAQITCDLNQKQLCERTIKITLDLSKAFGTVNHTTVLDVVKHSTLPPGLKRWTWCNGIIHVVVGFPYYFEVNILNQKELKRRFRRALSSPHYCLISTSQNSPNQQRKFSLPHTLMFAQYWRREIESMTWHGLQHFCRW